MNEGRLIRDVVLPILLSSVLIVWDFLQLNQLRRHLPAVVPGRGWQRGVGLDIDHLVDRRLAHRSDGPGHDRAAHDHASELRRSRPSETGKGRVVLGPAGWLSVLDVVRLRSFLPSRPVTSRGPTIATCGPPLALLVVVVAFLAEVAVLGRVIGEAEREWWARLSAWLLMSAVAWATFFGCLLFVPRS